MTEQSERWKGQFGGSYTDRNKPDWDSRTTAFRRMLDGQRADVSPAYHSYVDHMGS